MLKRPATTIRLTPEDIMEYDESVSMHKSTFDNPDRTQEEKSQGGISFKEPAQARNDRIGIKR
ncbi:hypothetical protein EJF18_10599 [Clavispora lusitaniae]|uniref:Uncharacterized protein n=2 Tax=Clavispora lusitaniae TaxID=36911 RepID=A0ACD0WD96_CLALS|nr:hypothetical protein A9F13_15g00440 [Clavispora lusitaniae]QFZ25503.1 hypothetical protein EJF14_10599 [Clavispora lusitaniae]QFZ31194.1 hypothetical protein EJF16_10599 [Clavispora lusitaniae]QFZ36862.1 hypothetical protein EJF15_10599 [Clavispora lusitaniae]QFZ42546.1 hypothetical protein EJF18_10599 [Clavispora lusitaniae]